MIICLLQQHPKLQIYQNIYLQYVYRSCNKRGSSQCPSCLGWGTKYTKGSSPGKKLLHPPHSLKNLTCPIILHVSERKDVCPYAWMCFIFVCQDSQGEKSERKTKQNCKIYLSYGFNSLLNRPRNLQTCQSNLCSQKNYEARTGYY